MRTCASWSSSKRPSQIRNPDFGDAHPSRKRNIIEEAINQSEPHTCIVLLYYSPRGDTTRNRSFVTLMTTLPTCLWDSKYEYALMASSNENTLSTTGWMCRAMRRWFMSSNLKRPPVSTKHRREMVTHCLTEPMRIPRKLMALPIVGRIGIPLSSYANATRLNAFCKKKAWTYFTPDTKPMT